MSDPRALLLIAQLLAVVLVARRWLRPTKALDHIPRWVLAAGAAAFVMALTTWVWHGLRAPPVVDDEAAYVLQADLFAHGRWKRASPQPSAAFTQPAVLVTPVLAPKMAPGHALLLAPGVAAGLPGIVPIVLSGTTAALIMLIACELQSPTTALLTVVLWITAAGQMRWRASYFSEITTGALWMLGWYALLQWRRSRRSGWLLVLAAATGWGAVTRPLTMLAFAVPVGVVVMRDIARTGLWRQLAGALAVGTVCLGILPLQNVEVLGNWRQSPLSLYTRQYMPYDVVGFGLDSTPPSIGLPATLQAAQQPFIARHREHVPSALPGVLMQRLRLLWLSAFGDWRVVWIPVAAVGLVVMGGAGWFAVASMLMLYLAYLFYAHEAHWTIYYLEASPVPAFVCAVGLARLLGLATGGGHPLVTALMTAAATLVVAFPDLDTSRVYRASAQRPFREMESAAAATGSDRVLVFVRYSAAHDPDVNLIRNVARPDRARLITAYDLGAASDARVITAYPGRRVLYWDGSTNRALPAPSMSAPSP